MYATGVDWYYCTIAYVLVDATPFKKALSIHSCKTPPHIAFTRLRTTPKHRSVYVDMVLMKRVMFSTASTHTFALYLIDLLLSVVTAPL
jgi:hypothetical protein